VVPKYPDAVLEVPRFGGLGFGEPAVFDADEGLSLVEAAVEDGEGGRWAGELAAIDEAIGGEDEPGFGVEAHGAADLDVEGDLGIEGAVNGIGRVGVGVVREGNVVPSCLAPT
jgi:hypothetical protein